MHERGFLLFLGQIQRFGGRLHFAQAALDRSRTAEGTVNGIAGLTQALLRLFKRVGKMAEVRERGKFNG